MPNKDLIQNVNPVGGKSETFETDAEHQGGQEDDNLENQQLDIAENDQNNPDWEGTESEPRRNVDRRNKVLYDQNVTLKTEMADLRGRFEQSQGDMARRMDEMQKQSDTKRDGWAHLTDQELSDIAVSQDEGVSSTQRSRANIELQKRLAKTEVNERVAPVENQTQYDQKNAVHWNNAVDELRQDGLLNDPDFNVDNHSSEIYRLANDIWTKNALDEAYRTNPRSSAEALREAKSRILTRKLAKATGKRNTEETREKKKASQLESGSTSGGQLPASNSKRQDEMMRKAVATGNWREMIADRISDKIPK